MSISSTTKIEQNAVNEVRSYIDATNCLRSYLKDNDRTPLWDGSVFVYKGEPDKKETLHGTINTQVKGTEVEAFKHKEQYRVERGELEIYMKEGGLFFFVVELLVSNIRERRIFYKKLSPIYIQALLDQKTTKTIEIPFDPIPTDFRILEDEMLNFISDSRKQTSFVGRQGLTLNEALKGNYQIKYEGFVNTVTNKSLAMQLTSQAFYLYQDTPYAMIPIRDIELTPLVTEHIEEPVCINGKEYFQRYSRKYDQKTITVNIGDCFITRTPKEGYAGTMPTHVKINYPNKGGIDDAINTAEFLVALKTSPTITFGQQTTPLNILIKYFFHNDLSYRKRLNGIISESRVALAMMENVPAKYPEHMNITADAIDKFDVGDLTSYAKLRMIVDYVSSMTDKYSVELYQTLSGNSL